MRGAPPVTDREAALIPGPTTGLPPSVHRHLSGWGPNPAGSRGHVTESASGTEGSTQASGRGVGPVDESCPAEPIFTKDFGGPRGSLSHEIIRPTEGFSIKLMKPESLGGGFLICTRPLQDSMRNPGSVFTR